MDVFKHYEKKAEELLKPSHWYNFLITRKKAMRILALAERDNEIRVEDAIVENNKILEEAKNTYEKVAEQCKADCELHQKEVNKQKEEYKKKVAEASKLAYCKAKCPYTYVHCWKAGCKKLRVYSESLNQSLNQVN